MDGLHTQSHYTRLEREEGGRGRRRIRTSVMPTPAAAAAAAAAAMTRNVHDVMHQFISFL